MAVQNPPIFIQAGTHPAEDARRWIDTMVGSRSGIRGAGDLAVTERGAGANMSVDVAAGRAAIVGSQSAFQGAYLVEAKSATNLTVAAAHASLPRKDLVVAKVEDQLYAGLTSAWSLAVVAGTAASSPVEPTPPPSAIVLAVVDVPAGDTAITNSQITDRRTTATGGRATALGGVIVCTSTTRPAHAEGRVIYETDTDVLLVSNGSGWTSVAPSSSLFVRKTADESVTSSTTLQNDDHLALPVAANTTYLLEMQLGVFHANTAEAPNLKVGWAGPSGAAMRWGYSGYVTGSATIGWVPTISDTIGLGGGGAGGYPQYTMHAYSGILTVASTAGTLQMKWAELFGASTTTVLQGSWLRLTPVT